MDKQKNEAIFDKVVFGGYDPEQVDDFVNETKKMIIGLKKENASLTQKLNILADKIEEYRLNRPEEQESEPAARQTAVYTVETESAEFEQIKKEKKRFCEELIKRYKVQLGNLEEMLDDGKVFSVLRETAEAEHHSEPAAEPAKIPEPVPQPALNADEIAAAIISEAPQPVPEESSSVAEEKAKADPAGDLTYDEYMSKILENAKNTAPAPDAPAAPVTISEPVKKEARPAENPPEKKRGSLLQMIKEAVHSVIDEEDEDEQEEEDDQPTLKFGKDYDVKSDK